MRNARILRPRGTRQGPATAQMCRSDRGPRLYQRSVPARGRRSGRLTSSRPRSDVSEACANLDERLSVPYTERQKWGTRSSGPARRRKSQRPWGFTDDSRGVCVAPARGLVQPPPARRGLKAGRRLGLTRRSHPLSCSVTDRSVAGRFDGWLCVAPNPRNDAPFLLVYTTPRPS